MTIIVGLVCFTLYYVGKEHISLLSPEVPLGTTVFAEEEGFEPPVPRSTTVFKTAAFDHSATPLYIVQSLIMTLPIRSPNWDCKDSGKFISANKRLQKIRGISEDPYRSAPKVPGTPLEDPFGIGQGVGADKSD